MGTTSNGLLELRRVVDCLILIDQSSIHQRALMEAANDATISAARIEELLSRSEDMKKNIFQVVGFFLVFQSVLITVVGQFSILRKDNSWIPLALSTAVGVGCFIAVCQCGMRIGHLRGNMYDEEGILKVAEKASSKLRRLGSDYSFPAPTEPKSKKRSTCVYFIPYALILISQWRIV